MPFNPKITDQPNQDKSHYHRNDFVTALLLDNTGSLASTPGGDIALSGNANQMTPITEASRVRGDRTTLWSATQYFKSNIFVGNGIEVYRAGVPGGPDLPAQIRFFDGEFGPTLWTNFADDFFGANILFWQVFEGGVFQGNPLVLYKNSVGVGNIIPSLAYALDVNGPAHAASFPVSSDARLKTNVQQLTGALDKLMQIKGVTFNWNAACKGQNYAPGTQIGVIAQDVQAQFPELITQWDHQCIKDSEPAGPFLAVDYGRLTAVLIEAIRELFDTVKQLQLKIEGMKNG